MLTPDHIRRPTYPHERVGSAGDVSDRLVALDRADDLEPALDALAQYDNLGTLRRTIVASVPQLEADLARKLVDGEIDLDAAVAKIVDAERLRDGDGPAARLIKTARAMAARRAYDIIVENADTIVTDRLRPDLHETLARTRALGPLLTTVTTDDQAHRAGPDVREAWAEARRLYDRFDIITGAFNRLVIDGYLDIPTSLGSGWFGEDLEWEHPHEPAAHTRATAVPLRLLDLAHDPRGRTLITPNELADRRRVRAA